MAIPALKVLRADLVLTTSYVATSALSVGEFPEAIFYLDWTNAASGADNTIQFFFEFSPDGTNWYRETHEDIAKATGILTTRAIERTWIQKAADTGDDLFEIPVKCPETNVRVQVKETVTSGAAGNLTVSARQQEADSGSRSEIPSVT